jgi:hypothetical protein
METEIKFKGRKYTFVETITTQITDEYIPDHGLYQAIRESAQNAYDEAMMSDSEVVPWMNGDEFYIRDTGRGVEFEDILHIGASGKRGVEGASGEHGEGEIISFLAATRLRVVKYMASKDWLATASFVVAGKHNVLAIHFYRTDSPRKGTGWLYRITPDSLVDHVDLENAWWRVRGEFKKHRAVNKKRERVFKSNPRGKLLSSGVEIEEMSGLLLGYDLDIAPGRDRARFTWIQVMGEIKELLAKHITPSLVSDLIWVAQEYGTNYREFELITLELPRAVVQRGAYLRTNSRSKNRVVWGLQSEASKLADAQGQGIKVMVFPTIDRVPRWVRDNFPNVGKAVGVTKAKKSTLRKTPNDFHEAVTAIFELMDEDADHPFEVHKELGNAAASTDGVTIQFNYKAAKAMTISELIGAVAHELAHDRSGAGDCTRAHTNEIEKILSDVAGKLATSDKARSLYKRAATRMARWAK